MLTLYTKNYKDFALHDTNHNPVHKFAGAKFADKALPGDYVEVTETGCTLVKRANHPPIAGLLELNSKTKYGFTAKNHPIYLFIPFNESYPPFVVGSSEKDTSKNRLALIQFDSWLDAFPRGNLQKLLDSEMEALSWTYTPLANQKYKAEIPLLPNLSTIKQRPIVTAFHIDPPDCRDVDDVLSITNKDDQTYITITISDVAAHIPKDHPIDQRAAQIAQTFYQDGNKPRHVFPSELSEDRLSLLPSTEPKLGLSLKFPLNDPSKTQWFESQVLTTKTYTYESVYNDSQICNTLKQMAQALNEPTDDSHKWIEVAMKFYNVEAAKLLQQHQTGLLRSHDEPNKDKIQSLMKINPDLQFLAYSSAQYVKSTEPNAYHFGLQSSAYTHATSPIRRYADLVNQRSIKALLNNQPIPPSPSPYHLNIVAKQAKRHDRDFTFIKALSQSSQINKTVQGQVLQLSLEDLNTKLSIYVPLWSLSVKLRYKTGDAPNIIVSKDEKTTHTIQEGQLVTLTYHADMTARNWKKRMVIRLL